MATSYPQFVLFGDSLFQNAASTLDGFSLQAALQELFIRRYDVVNRGFSGYNTAQALHVLPSLFPPLPSSPSAAAVPVPELAILAILLGANDAALPAPAGQANQHVSLADYEANLTALVTHPNIVARKPRKILLVTPPPLDGFRRAEYERLVERRSSTSRQARVTAAYAAAARRVAEAVPGVEVVDLWTVLTDLAAKRTPGFGGPNAPLLGDEQAPAGTSRSGYLEKLLTDGLHLSGEGYRVLFGELKRHVGGPSTAGEGWVHPEWRAAPWWKKA